MENRSSNQNPKTQFHEVYGISNLAYSSLFDQQDSSFREEEEKEPFELASETDDNTTVSVDPLDQYLFILT